MSDQRRPSKAVIPAAGLGTRFLPATKAIPKEMLPVVDVPALEYIVAEAAGVGLTDVLVITARGKEAIADHFDRSPELEAALEKKGDGDRLAAMREMLSGGPLDVLTGDYLAELTMLILARDRLRDPTAGYAKTFLRQLEDCLGLAVERGVKIVVNAGGLNPAGLAAAVSALADRLGLAVAVGHVLGDELPAADGIANAYLGGWGIVECLRGGADIVVTGRVTDASLLVGPAAWHHGWSRDDWDALAGATVAGATVAVTGGKPLI